MKKEIIIFMLIFSLLIVGCGNKKVKRISVDEVTDISGYWNDTDSKLVAEKMTQDCLSHKWLMDFGKKNGKKPVIIVGQIVNKSMEHIAIATFIKDIERSFVNSGTVKVVASVEEKGNVRKERISQQDFASLDTRKKLRNELGADYIMLGTVSMIIDENAKKQVRFYQINLELIDIETTEKVWIGEKKIKKLIE